jgi:hypothetical protein
MSRLSIKKFIIFLLIFSFGAAVCNGQASTRGRNPEKALFTKNRLHKTKDVKVKESPKVTKAKKAQEKKKEQLNKDYYNSVEKSKKLSYKIQTPEVQARMRQNKKDISVREKAKKRKDSATTKKAGKKYK